MPSRDGWRAYTSRLTAFGPIGKPNLWMILSVTEFKGPVLCSVADSNLTSVSSLGCPDNHIIPRNDLNDHPTSCFSVKLSGPSISSRKCLFSPLLSDSPAHRKGFRDCSLFPESIPVYELPRSTSSERIASDREQAREPLKASVLTASRSLI